LSLFQSEIQIFGVTGVGIEESQGSAAVECQGDHGPAALQADKDPCLQIFPHDVPAVNGITPVSKDIG
jgi:hypothetical protein